MFHSFESTKVKRGLGKKKSYQLVGKPKKRKKKIKIISSLASVINIFVQVLSQIDFHFC
jgi:hypothetical protein